MTEKRTKRGGARPNAGRPRVHEPGNQSSLYLGTGGEPARVRELFREVKNSLGFEHNHECLNYLLQQCSQRSW